MTETYDVHLMTPGKGVSNSFKDVIRSRKFRVDKVYVLEHEELKSESEDDDIQEIIESISELKDRCEDIGIDCIHWDIEDISVENILSAAMDIDKKEKAEEEKTRLFINVTHGTKIYSIGAFLSAMWINATPYYIYSREDIDNKEKIEFLETPNVDPYKVSKNSNYVAILEILDEDDDLRNRDILKVMRNEDMFTRIRNKGKKEKLTPGNLSSMLRNLEEWGLISIEQGDSRRENSNRITRNGRMMLKVLENG